MPVSIGGIRITRRFLARSWHAGGSIAYFPIFPRIASVFQPQIFGRFCGRSRLWCALKKKVGLTKVQPNSRGKTIKHVGHSKGRTLRDRKGAFFPSSSKKLETEEAAQRKSELRATGNR